MRKRTTLPLNEIAVKKNNDANQQSANVAQTQSATQQSTKPIKESKSDKKKISLAKNLTLAAGENAAETTDAGISAASRSSSNQSMTSNISLIRDSTSPSADNVIAAPMASGGAKASFTYTKSFKNLTVFKAPVNMISALYDTKKIAPTLPEKDIDTELEVPDNSLASQYFSEALQENPEEGELKVPDNSLVYPELAQQKEETNRKNETVSPPAPLKVTPFVSSAKGREGYDLDRIETWETVVELGIDINYAKNSHSLKSLVTQWKQILSAEQLSETQSPQSLLEKQIYQLSSIIDLMLADLTLSEPKCKLWGGNPFEKQLFNLPDGSSRFINFFILLDSIRAVFINTPIVTHTNIWFEKRFGEDNFKYLPLNKHLANEQIRYFPEQSVKIINEFFATFIIETRIHQAYYGVIDKMLSEVKTVLETSKAQNNNKNQVKPDKPKGDTPTSQKPLEQVKTDLETLAKAQKDNKHAIASITDIEIKVSKKFFLEQVKFDLEIVRKIIGKKFDVTRFHQTKFITFDSENPLDNAESADRESDRGFSDILDMLQFMKFPSLESIIIYDFRDTKSESNLQKLLRLIETNQANLEKVVLGSKIPPYMVDAIQDKLKKCLSDIKLNIIPPSPSTENSENGAFFPFFSSKQEVAKKSNEQSRSFISPFN